MLYGTVTSRMSALFRQIPPGYEHLRQSRKQDKQMTTQFKYPN